MIRNFLDASSGHLSADTWAWLDANLTDGVCPEPANAQAFAIADGLVNGGSS